MCLVYGMKRISFFTYWEPAHDEFWQWTNAMCDTEGNKMQHWYDVKEINMNLVAVEDTAPLSDEELKKIDEIREQLGSDFCRRCNYCAPCTKGISIPSVFLFEGYLSRYGLENWARDRYATLSAKASECIGCGACEARCPYHLPIRQMLKHCADQFGV